MYRLIVNPAAGTGKALKVSEEAKVYLKEKKIDFDLVYTERGRESGTILARKAVEEGIGTVIVFGGDGTISEVARGLLYTQTSLGVVPCGTGNDFVKAALIPKDYREAIDLILSVSAKPVDSCLMNDTFFLNLAGCGFDVATLEYAAAAKKHVKGIWPYLYGVIRSIFSYRPYDMTIRVDGKDISQKSLICAIGNGTCFGGGMPITPMAKITDGKLDVLVVEHVPKTMIVSKLSKLLDGTLYQLPIAHHYLAEEVFLSYPNMKIELDGEILSVESCHFTIQKQSVLLHCKGE